MFQNKTERQLLRKLKTEKKRNFEYYKECIDKYNERFNVKNNTLINEVFQYSEDCDDSSNTSFDSLDIVINNKINLINNNNFRIEEEEEIMPLDFYLNMFNE